ncbi:hypothetical protein HBI55_160330 [Parastagonospora nodorum]|nr:hypothetical protein HBI55_160330 [Parastagonospora nodorum]
MLNLASLLSVAFDAIENVELIGNLLGNADCVNNNNNNVAPTLQFSLTALLNLQSLALKRPALSSSDLNCGRTDPTIATLLAKRIKTNEDCKKSTHFRDNIEKLIYVSKVKHTYIQAYTVPYPNLKKYLSNSARNNRNNLNIIVTNPTSREFSRVNIKSLTRLSSKSPLGLPFLGLISMTLYKLDKVPTRELSSYIKTELYLHQKQALYFMLCDNSRKFYHLVITGEDTHYKQTIKKAYIMLLERALLILFMT